MSTPLSPMEALLSFLKVKFSQRGGSRCLTNAAFYIKLTLMVGSTRSMAAHCRGVRLLASSRMTCSCRESSSSQTELHSNDDEVLEFLLKTYFNRVNLNGGFPDLGID